MIFSGISACANSDFRMCKNMAKRVMQQVARATNNIMVVVLVVEFKTRGNINCDRLVSQDILYNRLL